MTVYGLPKPKNHKVAYLPFPISTFAPSAVDPNGALGYTDSVHFDAFWDLMDAIQLHGYMRAAMSVIGRSTIGAGWSLVQDEDAPSKGTERQRKRLLQFYTMPFKQWDNIKDFQSLNFKIMIAAMYLKYFGQAAFHILRNEAGAAIGFDHLPGYVVPNVDAQGKFKSPAFYQYPTRNPADRVEFVDQKDIIFITNPDWTGIPTGGTDMEALTDFALPIDMYLQLAAREYMKNRDKPEAFYVLPADVSDEAFDAFAAAIQARYAGPANVGRSPITVSGDLDIKELSRLPADLPYQQARQDTRQELLAVSGVTGAKMGLTDSLSSANLREARREFHETSMIPLFRLLETALYEQVHIREFSIYGWVFKFNNPDFLTLVERATVDMRYQGMGVLSPNEIRRDSLGKPPRKDDYGDRYADQAARDGTQNSNPQGSPPEGREQRPDSPSQTGEPTLDNQDPPRGDQHDDTTQRDLLDELRKWEDFQIKRVNKGGARSFVPHAIPDFLADAIQDDLSNKHDQKQVRAYFASVRALIREESNL